ncbi:MAG TPA: hypothetical protein VF755_26385 [Catenuloplanes sp.]|jgi:hypothetical protein
MKQRDHRPEPRLGVDIGRVIIDGPAHPAGPDTAFFTGDETTMLATPEVPGAVDAIARLVTAFDGRVWLVSKCGPRVRDRTWRWLHHHEFFARAGLPPHHVRFCRARPDKRVHCQQLGLTHFVDDHPDVHAAIRGQVSRQYFFGPQRRPVPAFGIHTPTWDDVERAIDRSLAGWNAAPVAGDPAGAR